ncbi:PucR family transcriptional regulator [Nocardioides sp.]|uniref:PucR family transcriptional regulator n=1 Tax=Nocardioides sp. TaxID=35761 RepID=UPI0039E6F198
MVEANETMVALGGELERVLPELTEAMHEEMIERIVELRGDHGLVELLRVSIQSNLAALVQVFSYQIEPDQVPTPLGAREYARRLAQHGVSVTALVRAYRLGQRRLVEWALEEWERDIVAPTGRPVPLATVGELIRTTSGYIDSISEQVIAEYDTERERWLAHRDRARADVLTRLVAGESVEIDTAERVLGYRLRQRHLGMVLWTADPAQQRPEPGLFESVLGRLAHAVGAGTPLLWPQDATSAFGWLPIGREPAVVPMAALGEALRARPTVRVAVGSLGAGIDGFRVTQREAAQARQVAAIAGDLAPPVTSYDDYGVRAAALLAADLPSARRLVTRALGDLAADTATAARLRETLLALVEENGSYVTTAERLHLHKNTVKYRVHKAIEARGRPVDEDRLDLELALLACKWFGTAVLAD